MKQIFIYLLLGSFITGCKNENKGDSMEVERGTVGETADKVKFERDSIRIVPVSHATAVIHWGDAVIYADPTGGATAFEDMEEPDFILVTDIHGDHMNIETLNAIRGNTQIVVPQAVKDELPEEMYPQLIVLNNGESREVNGFDIEAIPMYNLPEDAESRHLKGRGNGYVVERDGHRLYIAGDTEDIPEMRNLKNINIALVPMNMPYTMTIEKAAEGVLAFEPGQVYPYHYRGQDGLADVEKFKELVNSKNNDIEVILLEWYPQ